MKHILRKLFSLTAIFVAGLTGSAFDFEVDGIYYKITSSTDMTVEVTYKDQKNSYSGSVTIPETVSYSGSSYSVTSIGYNAFGYCTGLTEVTIPNTVISIGAESFWNCTGLTKVIIPNSVISIGNSVFGQCSGLTEVTIPNSVTSIGQFVFIRCTGLTSVTISNSVETIDNFAFAQCSGLTSVTIPNSVTSIGNNAFKGCTGLTSVNVPNSVTSIGYNTFLNCTGLTSVTIGNLVETIGQYAFKGCPLKEVICLSSTPPTCESDNTFSCYDTASLKVLEASAYKTSDVWCKFANIVEIAIVNVSTEESSASFEIPTKDEATSYTVNVYSDEAMTQLVASTNYDVDGKIIPMSTTLELSIEGFDSGTYYYDVIVKSENGETLSNYTGKFEISTSITTNIDSIAVSNDATEVSRYDVNGRLLKEPTPGVNIVRYSDGTTRKVFVK